MDQDTEKPLTHGTSNLTDEDITQAVLDSFGNSRSERFQVVMESLVKHLHAFIKEVKLTEDEWFKGIDYLTRTGHITGLLSSSRTLETGALADFGICFHSGCFFSPGRAS